jgi:hypothetical protein
VLQQALAHHHLAKNHPSVVVLVELNSLVSLAEN